MLHADLYRENVPFDDAGLPRLIDPLPMLGDAAFDWAFWTVYYDLGEGTAERLATAARISRIPVTELIPWCRLLALDGLLYYLESGDERAPRMAQRALRSLDPQAQGVARDHVHPPPRPDRRTASGTSSTATSTQSIQLNEEGRAGRHSRPVRDPRERGADLAGQ